MTDPPVSSARRIIFTALAVVSLVFVVQFVYRETGSYWEGRGPPRMSGEAWPFISHSRKWSTCKSTATESKPSASLLG